MSHIGEAYCHACHTWIAPDGELCPLCGRRLFEVVCVKPNTIPAKVNKQRIEAHLKRYAPLPWEKKPCQP